MTAQHDHSPHTAANLATVERYYAAINAGAMDEAFACLSRDVVQEEFPNRLVNTGVVRDLATLRDAWARGRTVIATQRFAVLRAYAAADAVVIEGDWTGTVARDVGPFTAGAVLHARFAQVLELRDGRITAIRNYDCFDPW
jgi:ketosteroid isomerase-like protein